MDFIRKKISKHNRSGGYNTHIIIFLVLFTMLFSAFEMKVAVQVLFILVCSFSILYNRKYLFLIYIVYLPTNGLISVDNNLLRLLQVSDIINLFAFVAVLLEWNSLTASEINSIKRGFTTKKHVYYLVIIIFLYLTLNEYRQLFQEMIDISIQQLIIRTIKYSLLLIPLMFLIKFSVINPYNSIIRRGFILSVVIITLGMIFSDYLPHLGITTQDTYGNQLEFIQEDTRKAGVFTPYGDVNSAAGFLCVGFSFILFSYKTLSDKRKTILLFLLLLALISADSRASFGSVLVILVYYALSDRKKKSKKVQVILLLGIMFFLLNWLGLFDPVKERFISLNNEETTHLDPTYEFGRVGGWLLYLKYIFSDGMVLLFGTTQDIYIKLGYTSITRVAHNFYIQLLYYWGIIPFLFLFRLFGLYIKGSLRSSDRNILIALLLPCLITLFFVSDPGVYWGFFVAVSSIHCRNYSTYEQ